MNTYSTSEPSNDGEINNDQIIEIQKSSHEQDAENVHPDNGHDEASLNGSSPLNSAKKD